MAAAVKKSTLVDQSAHDKGPTPAPRQRSGAVVTVACRLPIGWLDLQLCKMVTVSEQTTVGPREVEQAVRFGPVVRIRGTAYPAGQIPAGYPGRQEVAHGFALTRDVSLSFMEEWAKQHARAEYVINQLVIFDENLERLRDRCRELNQGPGSVATGLEPLRFEKDPRLPRPISPNISGIEVEDSRKSMIEKLVASQEAAAMEAAR